MEKLDLFNANLESAEDKKNRLFNRYADHNDLRNRLVKPIVTYNVPVTIGGVTRTESITEIISDLDINRIVTSILSTLARKINFSLFKGNEDDIFKKELLDSMESFLELVRDDLDSVKQKFNMFLPTPVDENVLDVLVIDIIRLSDLEKFILDIFDYVYKDKSREELIDYVNDSKLIIRPGKIASADNYNEIKFPRDILTSLLI